VQGHKNKLEFEQKGFIQPRLNHKIDPSPIFGVENAEDSRALLTVQQERGQFNTGLTVCTRANFDLLNKKCLFKGGI
jgi:hypothetical protein